MLNDSLEHLWRGRTPHPNYPNQGRIVSITEKVIENQILTYLKYKKIFTFKNQSTGIFDPKKKVFRKSNNVHHINGVSDILGIVDGKFLAIEVKKPYVSKKTNQFKYRTQEELEKLASEDQINFVNRVKSLGGIAFFADSIDTVEDQLILFGVITLE
jgi:hypothetical protein